LLKTNSWSIECKREITVSRNKLKTGKINTERQMLVLETLKIIFSGTIKKKKS